MEPNSTLAAYDAVAPVYEEYSSKKQPYLDAVDQLVIENLSPQTRLLDIGAGDGRRLAKVQSNIELTECIAIEPSPEMAKRCAERAQVTVHQTLAENLDTLDIGQFDTIIALWNVFGHISSSEERLEALRHIAAKLKPGGLFMLDVNNRHNALAYGALNVMKRVVIDTLNFKESRGDASYEWVIGDQTFKGRGHLFTPAEIESLFKKAGLEIVKRCSLNYATGEISHSKYHGQLFYILTRA
jgi:SAM-dependent methyltransferase